MTKAKTPKALDAIADVVLGYRPVARSKPAVTKKRGYTYAFTPKSEKHGRYLLDKIPADLWRRVKARSKREGVSVRAFLLQQLTKWVERDE